MLAGWEWAKLAPKKKHSKKPKKELSKEKSWLESIQSKGAALLLIAALFFAMLAYRFFGIDSLILLPLFMLGSLLLLPENQQHELVGMAYLAAFGIGFLAIHDRLGISALGWLVVVVVAFDTAAFAAGKAIRGPLLCPEISPDKRWAGLIAGLIAASLCGAIWLQIFNSGFSQGFSLAKSFGLSLLVALAAQAGDLAESRMKRLIGVKDSGEILPGHGGILDRIDGFLGATPMAFLLLSLEDKLQLP